MARDTQDRRLYSIGRFAKLTGFPVKTLRYYDEEGVLKPACVDPETGYRSYTEAHRNAMHLLAEVHILGVPVDLLRDFMRDPTLEHQGELYEWKIRQLKQEIRERQQNLHSLERKRQHPWRSQQYEVNIDDLPSRPWTCVHYVTNMRGLESNREQAFHTVRAFLAQQGSSPASPPISFGLPTREHRDILTGVEVYAGFEVHEPAPAKGNVLVGSTPAGRWYGVQHTGPYEHIWHVKTMLLEQLLREGVRVQRGLGEFITQEVFHVGPWDTPDAGNWVTDVRWLVRQDDPGSVIPGAVAPLPTDRS